MRLSRKQYFVDPKVQGALMIRAALYWCFCIVSIITMVLCWRIVTGPARVFYTHFDDMWFHMGPALVTAALLLPIILTDVVRMSNRFTGPLLRLRNSMRAVAQGQQVAPLRYRPNDFWHEVAEEFNALAARVAQLEAGQVRRDGDDFDLDAQPAAETSVGL